MWFQCSCQTLVFFYEYKEKSVSYLHKLHLAAGRIQPLRLGGAISVISDTQSYNGVAGARPMEMKYSSQHCCDKTMDDKMALYHECCFPNCTKLWWIKLLSKVLGARSLQLTPWIRPCLAGRQNIRMPSMRLQFLQVCWAWRPSRTKC